VRTLLEAEAPYMYTLRTGACNVLTCLAHDGEGRLVAGAANGALAAVQLGGGGGGGEAPQGWERVRALPIGVEELPAEEGEEGEGEEGREGDA
jgi:hypothetical protein